MRLTVDPGAPEPPYAQVRAQLADSIRDGSLGPGTRLPTVRRLAGDLDLAPNTVARAYRELEGARLIETRGRNGTFVADLPTEPLDTIKVEVANLADRVRQLGVPPEEAVRLLAHSLGVTPR